jgi:multicomponent Na+:H+ antiporter subunit A
MRTHIIWLLGTIGILASFLYSRPNFLMIYEPLLRFDFLIVLLIISIGAMAVVRANSHIMGVLFLSLFGFMIAVFYLLSNAPDVALTQLAVETIILVVFLVIIGKLPAYYGATSSSRVIRDIFLSLFIGITIFFTVITATTSSASKDIATFFIDRASYPPISAENIIVDYGGGTNIVNVILVDFRALDTLGEISVVALAALSILTILSSRKPGDSP